MRQPEEEEEPEVQTQPEEEEEPEVQAQPEEEEEPVATKSELPIGAPGDRNEREADAVADRVMAMPEPGVQRQELEEEEPPEVQGQVEEEEELVQKKPSIGGSPQQGAVTRAKLHAAVCPGQPLAAATRDFYEPRFGRDFGGVRVHTCDDAVEMCRGLKAQAFTYRNNIFFNKGKYEPGTSSGKRLLAHELAHTVQQSKFGSRVQMVCDPATLSGRIKPVFFPAEGIIMAVFTGQLALRQWTPHKAAVGLFQQALVDMGYDIGMGRYGPRRDGVDRIFGPYTERGLREFQVDEGIPVASHGKVDKPTLRCLDEVRSKPKWTVPCHQTGVVPPGQYQIESAETGGRDEDVFFARVDSVLNAESEKKVKKLAAREKGRPLTLYGFISEDELVDFGEKLADDRIKAVDAKFAAEGHGPGGLRIPSPQPKVSSGIADYRRRRKVEVVPAAKAPTTAMCPPGAPMYRPLNKVGPTGASPKSEKEIVNDAVDKGVKWMDQAIPKLTPGNTEGDNALTTYFGGTTHRAVIKAKLAKWRKYLDGVTRRQTFHGTLCNSACETLKAYYQQREGIIACPKFFSGMKFHPPLNQDEKRAFVLMHETGHASVDTSDYAYGHRRSIEFFADYPSLALENTDSYTLTVLCLSDFPRDFCKAPVPSDEWVGIPSPNDRKKARRGLGWLESWLTWAKQDLSGLYRVMHEARLSGQWTNWYYRHNVLPPLFKAFDIRRPEPQTEALPTFREQTTVAAIRDRYLLMRGATETPEAAEVTGKSKLKVERAVGAVSTWVPGGDEPKRHVYLGYTYFNLPTDRSRVETLLPLIIAATPTIDPGRRPAYEQFVKEDIRVSPMWKNAPSP
jgi:hypothetical protein